MLPMMPQPQARISAEEYLAADRAAAEKSEFLNGEVFAMAGVSRPHNLIALNVAAEIRSQLKNRSCEVYPSDMRVRISETGLYAYPDVTVVCGKAEFADDQQDMLLNPVVIVEVLSETTEAYDRGEKFAHYRLLPSLKEYVLIAQDRVAVERYVRHGEGEWLLSDARSLNDEIELASIACRLKVAEVYDKVDLRSVSEGGPAEIASF